MFQNDLGYTGFFGTASDLKIKKNINTIPNARSIVNNLRGVSYEHKLDEFPNLGLKAGLTYGFIAQDFEVLFPELVSTKPGKPEKVKAINYLEIIPLLVGKMQKMQNEIDELRGLLQNQTNQINQTTVKTKE